MYTLTLNFKTTEELAAFVVSQMPKTNEVQLPLDIPPVIETPKRAPKKAKETVKEEIPVQEPVTVQAVAAQVEEEMIEVESPFTRPTFDRDAAVVRAKQLVAELKKLGIEDTKLVAILHEVYGEAGCPLNLKVSDLDDSLLAKFMPLFENKVLSMSKPSSAASFI